MKLDITIYIHDCCDNSDIKEILSILKHFQKEGIQVAESAEVTAFRERVDTALQNISADIQRILAGATGLSAEDREALEGIATRIEAVAQIVPE